MAEKNIKPRGLGRGLSALMADVQPDQKSETESARTSTERLIPIESLVPNPNQPRQTFSHSDLEELCASIKEKGVIQPLIVRRLKDNDTYEIVAGERRWRAAQMAQLHEIPVIVREFSDSEVLEVAIIENIQRADLNPIDEAAGYRQLMDRFGHTQEKLSSAMGKSRSHIANLLRLLQLPEEVKSMVVDGRLSAGHARALLTSENPMLLAKTVTDRGLSVRETERLVKGNVVKKPASPNESKPHKDADTKALENDIGANLKMAVSILHETGGESGTLTIRYKTLDQLDELCRLLSGG